MSAQVTSPLNPPVVYSFFDTHKNILGNYCPHFTDGDAEVQMETQHS